LDIHRDFCEVAIQEAGELRSAGRIDTSPAALELFAGSLGPDDWVAFEVSGNAAEIARILEPHVARVVVVSPSDTGIRQARAKTDRLDARTLARLLAAGSLQAVWMADQQTRVMRRRLARRAQLMTGRSRCKNEIHAVLIRRLIARPKVSDLFGQAGRRWLEQLELPLEERESVDAGMRQIEFLERELADVDRLVALDALGSAEVKRLMSVPGVNVICAASFLAAVGDISRFNDPRKLVGYLGLDPKVRQSGPGPGTSGHISKQGSASARWALVEASWSAVRQPGPLRACSCPPRPPDRDRRRRQKARLPVLVPAHPRAGLRLRPTVADQEKAAPPRDRRRRPEIPGPLEHLVNQQRNARSRTRAR
jgi:transposase